MACSRCEGLDGRFLIDGEPLCAECLALRYAVKARDLANKFRRRAAENVNTANVYTSRGGFEALRLAELARTRADAYRTAVLDVIAIFHLTDPRPIRHEENPGDGEENVT